MGRHFHQKVHDHTSHDHHSPRISPCLYLNNLTLFSYLRCLKKKRYLTMVEMNTNTGKECKYCWFKKRSSLPIVRPCFLLFVLYLSCQSFYGMDQLLAKLPFECFFSHGHLQNELKTCASLSYNLKT